MIPGTHKFFEERWFLYSPDKAEDIERLLLTQAWKAFPEPFFIQGGGLQSQDTPTQGELKHGFPRGGVIPGRWIPSLELHPLHVTLRIDLDWRTYCYGIGVVPRGLRHIEISSSAQIRWEDIKSLDQVSGVIDSLIRSLKRQLELGYEANGSGAEIHNRTDKTPPDAGGGCPE